MEEFKGVRWEFQWNFQWNFLSPIDLEKSIFIICDIGVTQNQTGVQISGWIQTRSSTIASWAAIGKHLPAARLCVLLTDR